MENNVAVLNPETAQVETNQNQPEVPAQEKPAVTEGAPNKSEEEPGPEGSEHTKEGGYQRVKRQRDEARRNEQYWREQAIKTSAAPKTETPVTAEDEPEPEAKDFPEEKGGLDAYLKAVRAYDRKMIVKEIESKQSKTEQARNEQTEAEKEAARFEEAEKTASTKFTDYAEASDAAIEALSDYSSPATKAIGKAIAAHARGPELLYELGKNPAEVERLSKLQPVQAVMELGMIAARIAGHEPAPVQATDPAPISKAPTPTTPIRKTSPVSSKPDPLSAAAPQLEFEKEMNKRQFGK